jgi:hypothetical protein
MSNPQTDLISILIDHQYGRVIKLVDANERIDTLFEGMTPVQRGLLVAHVVESRMNRVLEGEFGLDKAVSEKLVRAAYEKIKVQVDGQ